MNQKRKVFTILSALTLAGTWGAAAWAQGEFFEAVLILALFFSFLFHSPFRLWENTAGKPNAAGGG